jgi:hypothetical protein
MTLSLLSGSSPSPGIHQFVSPKNLTLSNADEMCTLLDGADYAN